MNKALATNLRKARMHLKMKRKDVSRDLGLNPRTYESYEQGRAEPSAERLVQIAEYYEIENLQAFISDPNFDITQQHKVRIQVSRTPLQSNYAKLRGKQKAAVDILLGLRSL